jgi:GTP-binding protein YchF
MASVGIVGLPNVGKSTLFNALTRSRKAEVANYPFCTIDPNVGVVLVPDERLKPLAKLVKTEKIIPAAIEFVDIAGLVAGASTGEGLGNKFLANIREVDVIVQVVRCFDDTSIIHSMGATDPIRDIDVVTTELVLADLQSVDSQLDKAQKKAKGRDKEALLNIPLLEKLQVHLNQNKPANVLDLLEDEKIRLKQFHLLSEKPVIYACNVAETDLADPDGNDYVRKVRDYVRQHHDAASCVISARLEADLAELSPDDAKAFLAELHVQDSGVSQLIQSAYALLGLASYFTAGEKEVRAWTFKCGMKAPQCAGVIHTDFEKGFIKAEVVSYQDLISAGSYLHAKELGKMRLEGKEYLFRDGDIANFKFAP